MRRSVAAFLLVFIMLVSSACGSDGGAGQAETPIPTSPIVGSTTEPSPIAPVAATSTLDPAPVETEQPGLESTPTLDQTTPPTDAPIPSEQAANATAFPDPNGYTWQMIASGFDSSIGIESAYDGTGRLFVVEQAGRILVFQEGIGENRVFLDIVDRVGSSGNEQGLLGLAFHPNYPENGYFYVNYTDKNGDTHISRFQVSADPNQADPASEKELLFVDQPNANHNGGGLEFGLDGFLYIALGDGGSQGDPRGNGQSLQTHLGKILRIDVDNGDPYAIPPDNPFASGGGLPEIWAYGLRNPWRIAFDQANGDLWIGDVGQNAWEEVDYLPADYPPPANFGWDYREGAHPFEGTPPEGLELIEPVAEYDRSFGVAVTGGEVYRGPALPEWTGIYLYADHYTGYMWGLLPLGGGSFQEQQLFRIQGMVASFGEDEAGEVLIVTRGGEVMRLVRNE